MKVAAIILAAGKGTRMKSNLVKVMHKLGEKPLIFWPVNAAKNVGAAPIIVVSGHQSEKVKEFFSGDEVLLFAEQKELLGTGDAVLSALPQLSGFQGNVLILCGDVPLIRPETLRDMLSSHNNSGATLTVLTSYQEAPFGYGRVVKGDNAEIVKIVEERDATDEERKIKEVNSGIYCVAADFLIEAVKKLDNNNAQGEYYLTDIVSKAVEKNLKCAAFPAKDPDEVMGINDRVQLAKAGAVLCNRINTKYMLEGVTMIDPLTTYIEDGIIIGKDTIIYPNTCISGDSTIGENCIIEAGVTICRSSIGDNVTVKAGTIISESKVGNNTSLGPMAHLRPGTVLGSNVKIGNFVETKKTVMGDGSKASHLTYLGDAEIGKDVNIGCGTITCNYDGINKHKTVIQDRVFVGSDVQFVAPVEIGENALIAAGTTVTENVPPDALAIARTPQVNKEGWRKK
ncbi:MAG: bifunctional UDP-N-acetylglucosamine diphosphorylase/glucosamine-1-phosphate N-acetyltransferase GlmU [Desulfuromonadales bacterium]|nr:bifunctional UDP-N-acetylglucosamine diphosphorylase/glucosamine-1-phosphate N-acetyltransferase GlmU [Desulfuromonadales bacterium]